MLMIRPDLARSIGFSARRISRNAPGRSTSSTDDHSSSLSEGARLSALIPALFTSTRTGDSSPDSTAANSASGVAGSDTSPQTAIARYPCRSISDTTVSAPGRLDRELTATGPPSRASAWAIAAPIPREAPVTSAQPSRGGADLGTGELHVGQRALGQAGEDPAWADLQEAIRAAVSQRQQRLAPAHGHRQRLHQTDATVVKRLRCDGRDHRDAREADLHARQRGGELRHGGGHHRRVKRTGYVELAPPQSELPGVSLGGEQRRPGA